MKTDKNTIIGFVLLFVLFILYFWYNTQQQQSLAEEKRKEQQRQDSIARANAAKTPENTTGVKTDGVYKDSLQNAGVAFNFGRGGAIQTVVVENGVMKATFTSKGGMLQQVELKEFKSWDSSQVILSGGKDDKLAYSINTDNNRSAYTNELNFTPSPVTKNPDGSQLVTFTLSAADGRSIVHQYIIRQDDYLIDWNVIISGADRLLSQNLLNMSWNVDTKQHQKDISYERQQSRLCYIVDADYDFTNAAEGIQENFTGPVDWFGFKQQFFNTTIIARNKFESVNVEMQKLPDATHKLFDNTATMQLKMPAGSTGTAAFQLYYGPNDYKILKSYNNGMMNIVDLGSGIFAFVKYINRWIIMPVFDLFTSFVGQLGWAIALLTLFIRLITAPLTYSSYLSGAKMKALRPELDILKKKLNGDQQAFAMEQMKLFREAGVNPLGGCIPALLQIPIFFSLYSFFNSHLALRGEKFLWADDLSQYDMIAQLPFSIPFFGDHISLFTLTAVITSFLISAYNMSMTPQQDNPVMKYMPYIFPVILLFIFNSLPAALTWYYTVSNIITLGLQYVIQNYIIDHDKVLAKIEEKRKQPKKSSKWQERMAQMQETQKKMQEMKQRSGQNKK